MRPETHTLRLARHTITYQVMGQGWPVVLVHGLAGSWRWWRKNTTYLAQRFRVYQVDLPGFGASSEHGLGWLRGGDFGLAQAAGVLLAWMDALDIQRAHLVGHSMGGVISADLAARWPERVGRLVLVDAPAVPIAQPFRRVALRLTRMVTVLPLDFMPVLVSDTVKAGPGTLAAAIRQILDCDLSARLPHIRAQVLIVWGQRDLLLPPSLGQALHRRLPAAQFALLEGAGHNPMWDRPERFNPLVGGFLNETP